MLVNSLAGSQELTCTKEQAAEVLAEAGLSETVRGEALTLAQFAEIANRIV